MNLHLSRFVRRCVPCEWLCLAAISLAFVACRSWNPERIKLADRAVRSSANIDPDTYRLRYESHQIYGCEPEELGYVQLARVKRWCRCVQSIEKCAARGLDSLSDAECHDITELMPKRYPHLEEYPVYVEIVRTCRRRLIGAIAMRRN
ncbi:MAG TPA: hypothetical protein VMV69_14805 [Pirellulales bacterium]|nr:hypothetical protein [Pirellulales bacterium]